MIDDAEYADRASSSVGRSVEWDRIQSVE